MTTTYLRRQNTSSVIRLTPNKEEESDDNDESNREENESSAVLVVEVTNEADSAQRVSVDLANREITNGRPSTPVMDQLENLL